MCCTASSASLCSSTSNSNLPGMYPCTSWHDGTEDVGFVLGGAGGAFFCASFRSSMRRFLRAWNSSLGMSSDNLKSYGSARSASGKFLESI